MVDFTGKYTENPTHAQTANTRPSLLMNAAWGRGYRESGYEAYNNIVYMPHICSVVSVCLVLSLTPFA